MELWLLLLLLLLRVGGGGCGVCGGCGCGVVVGGGVGITWIAVLDEVRGDRRTRRRVSGDVSYKRCPVVKRLPHTKSEHLHLGDIAPLCSAALQ